MKQFNHSHLKCHFTNCNHITNSFITIRKVSVITVICINGQNYLRQRKKEVINPVKCQREVVTHQSPPRSSNITLNQNQPISSNAFSQKRPSLQCPSHSNPYILPLPYKILRQVIHRPTHSQNATHNRPANPGRKPKLSPPPSAHTTPAQSSHSHCPELSILALP